MVTVIDHPLIQHKLSILRDRNTSVRDFRDLCREISMLMAFEAMHDLTLEDARIQTPVAPAPPVKFTPEQMKAKVAGADVFATPKLEFPYTQPALPKREPPPLPPKPKEGQTGQAEPTTPTQAQQSKGGGAKKAPPIPPWARHVVVGADTDFMKAAAPPPKAAAPGGKAAVTAPASPPPRASTRPPAGTVAACGPPPDCPAAQSWP